MSTFTVHIPDELGVPTERFLWQLTRFALEAVEPGAATHCLGRFLGDGPDDTSSWEHHRLGVTIAGPAEFPSDQHGFCSRARVPQEAR